MSIAAGFIVVFGTSIWYLNYKSGTQEPTFKTIENDILPGSNKATITFGNGKAINLKETEGILVTPSGLTYSDGSSINDSEFIGSAILKTPRGGQYKITLADGSKVWLNSNSSLEYPVKFSNNNREVRLNGEAYFEVHHDPKHPFLVNTTLQEVKVLGTTFNIRAYEDKQYTTLVQGSVEIKSNGSTFTRKLKPNEQAIIDHYSLSIKNVDALDFIGWKEGLINSGNISLVELSKEVERWYDVDFKFPQNFKNSESADLSINKNENLSTVLKVIDKTYGVKTEIHGKEVIIR
ncbi:FecR family protein [Chryseobacterium indologenes]|nr:FecR family protein [Chryseobacterium indologenes]